MRQMWGWDRCVTSRLPPFNYYNFEFDNIKVNRAEIVSLNYCSSKLHGSNSKANDSNHIHHYKDHLWFFSPEGCSHDAAVPGTSTTTGVVVVHAQVVAHLVGQRRPDRDGSVSVILRGNQLLSVQPFQFYCSFCFVAVKVPRSPKRKLPVPNNSSPPYFNHATLFFGGFVRDSKYPCETKTTSSLKCHIPECVTFVSSGREIWIHTRTLLLFKCHLIIFINKALFCCDTQTELLHLDLRPGHIQYIYTRILSMLQQSFK